MSSSTGHTLRRRARAAECAAEAVRLEAAQELLLEFVAGEGAAAAPAAATAAAAAVVKASGREAELEAALEELAPASNDSFDSRFRV